MDRTGTHQPHRHLLPTDACRQRNDRPVIRPDGEDQDAAAIVGRRAAYGRLAHELAPALLGLARRLCSGRNAEAEDLVQEALVRGYEAYVDGRFGAGTNARAWLMRILFNGFVNADKRR